MRKNIKKCIAVLAMVATLASSNLVVLAADSAETTEQTAEQINNTVDVLYDNSFLRGASKPSASKVKNLSSDSYDYEVPSIGYRVYTNYCFTGVTDIDVDVYNWNIISRPAGNVTTDKLTIKLYNSGGTLIGTSTETVYDSCYVSFTNLDATKKYYVLFEVPTNSVRYSFDGTISGS